jgi:hypothetical protein
VNNAFGWSEVIAALIGVIAAGGIQTITSLRNRKRQSEAVLTALSSEVDSICRLIRHQGYLEAVGAIANDIERGMWNGTSYIIDIRSNYFVVFEGLVHELGHLQPMQCAKIVNFYAYCRSAIDCTRPDGPHAQHPRTQEAAENMASVAVILQTLLQLGDEIVQMPKLPLEAAR